MTKRYIDPDKIDLKLGVLEADGELLIPLSAVRTAIAAAPSEDVVEVVRCEDCAVTEKDLAEMNKQIEEMARTMCRYYTTHGCALGTKSCGRHCDYYEDAERLYTAGYRKQSEGEWEYHECVSSHDGVKSGYSCTNCRAFVDENIFDLDEFNKAFCGACGAKMK